MKPRIPGLNYATKIGGTLAIIVLRSIHVTGTIIYAIQMLILPFGVKIALFSKLLQEILPPYMI